MLRRPVAFTGNRLALNCATSVAGCLRVELLDGDGLALLGFGLSDAAELIGDEVEGYARWKQGPGVEAAQGGWCGYGSI